MPTAVHAANDAIALTVPEGFVSPDLPHLTTLDHLNGLLPYTSGALRTVLRELIKDVKAKAPREEVAESVREIVEQWPGSTYATFAQRALAELSTVPAS